MVSTTVNPKIYQTTPAIQPKTQGANSGVQFSGASDAISAFIGLIDRSRAAELIASDGFGMLVPRTGVAAAFRGVDDARETLIREGAGLICVTLLAGITNQVMVHLLGNRVGLFNPHGTPGKAWISAKNLRVFSELYDQALTTTNSLSDARQRFIQTILGGLESGDQQLSITGRLANLTNISQGSAGKPVAKRALQQMAHSVDSIRLKDSKTLYNLLQTGQTEHLKSAFLEAGWGKLSGQGKTELFNRFHPKMSENAIQSIDAQAWKRVMQAKPNLSEAQATLAFLKERLRLSLETIKNADVEFLKHADRLALENGLTSLVNLKHEGKTLSASQSRPTLLKELKHFLDHYVDRAAYQASHARFGKQATGLVWQEQRQLVRQALFAAGPKGFGSIVPRAGQGLVTAALKAKAGYTWLPIAIAISANGLTTFLNNYITQLKYGGKVFFPGEESFMPTTASKLTPGQSPLGRPGLMVNTQTGRWA